MTASSANLEADSSRARVLIVALSLVVIAVATLTVYATPRQVTDGSPSALANLNASLNAVAGCCLLLGYVFIRGKRVALHRACMLVAFGVSCLFLVTYLMHHSQVGSIPFQGRGFIRIVYFSILLPHIVLAAAIVPLALFTLYRGLTGRVAAHRRLARVTLPLWLFVSFSGVVVYFMLYHL